MLFLIALILAICFAVFLGKPLKKCPLAFYAAAVIISAAVAAFNFRGVPAFVSNYIIALFSRGAFATGLWAVVMWTGALPNGSKAIKKLMPIRGELSIFAALLTLGHNIGFGKTYFVRMFTAPSSMSAQQLAAGIISIIMLAIMLPLTVMSFPGVRKKMKPKTWKKIQRSAYAFYALIYVHVMILSVPFAIAGRSGYLLSVAAYSVVFIGYAACRVRKQIILKKKPKTKGTLNFCSSGAAVILCAMIIAIAVPKTSSANSGNISEKSESSSAEIPQSSLAISSSSSVKSEIPQSYETSSQSIPEASPAASDTVSSSSESSVIPESSIIPESSVIPAPAESEPQPIESENPTPEPEYIYNNGTYSASAYGYDGDIFVTITIENDKIVSVKAESEESDLWYFDSAADTVISRIISTQSTDVDAVSGATFSSKGIMAAVENALSSAKKR